MVEMGNVVLASIIALASFFVLVILLSPVVRWIQDQKCQPTVQGPPEPPPCMCASECPDACSNVPALKLLSRGKPVTINPPWQSYPGSNLTDGDYGTFAHSADWISTTNVSATVDLGQKYTIRKIKIFNRMDCCQDRFGYHKLFVDEVKVADGDAMGAWEYEYCINIDGQKVKIEMDGILNLGEIEIWGYSSL